MTARQRTSLTRARVVSRVACVQLKHALPEESLDRVDFVVRGEGDEAILELMAASECGPKAAEARS